MKYIFLTLFTTMSILACSSLKNEQVNDYVITYNAYSRGFSSTYIIDKNQITVKNGRDDDQVKSSVISSAERKKLDLILKSINLSQLNDYQPPSEERTRDAAPHADLSIQFKGKTYTSQTFDHGNPPLQIEALTKTIIRLAETVE
ncbi:hypothetical protein L1I30_02405 [Gillisia sp. M10.2A]|uniref:Lipoprotein n=1 Tax=Gillisia lutea TaxID=2909668 RepID=A0ABS9EEB9_9FLAO|nr:hypothetical protein [Gillisia lutea]MCF4100509.1 hypothetical protein [Gillisia lutea]